MERGREFLSSIFRREDDAALSRRDILAGLGLAGLLLATPKLLSSSPAEANALEPVEAAAGPSPAPENKSAAAQGAEEGDATDLSSRRRWWRRRWRRRWWRRRWRRRYWFRRRRFWRRRYWRRRYWRRRYWY